MNRPKITLPKTRFDRLLEGMTWALLLGTVLILGSYYGSLSENIAIPFNWPSKDENGFASKDTLWASPLIYGILILGIHQLNRFPWLFNYPTTITKENAAYQYKQATRLLRFLNLVIGFLCFSLTLVAILQGLGIVQDLDRFILPIFLSILFGLPLLYLLRLVFYGKSKK